MAVSALIAVRLAEMVVGLTAHERFQAVRHLDSGGGGFMTSRGFTIAMVVVLAGSIIAFVVVNLHRKVSELKAAEDAFSNGAARKRLTELETDLLMAIAVNVGLNKSEDIFSMGEAFEQGAATLLSESRSGGKPTAETGRLEKQLAGLREKLGFRKVSSSVASISVKPVDKSAGAKPANFSVGKAAFIAMFPFAKKLGPAGNGDQGRPKQEWSRQLPEFLPAIVTGLVGRVVFLETTLAASVGDRVLVVIGLARVGEGAQIPELIEDIGLVQQTAQPAELVELPNARRLAVELAGLSEAQIAQLSEAVAGVKTTAPAKQDTGVSQEVENVTPQPAGAKEGPK